MFQALVDGFVTGIKATTLPEYIAVVAGIVSVWFSKKENILVFPTGLINTIIYVYLSFKYHLIGEAGVNFYYTIMSIWGWMLWLKKDNAQKRVVQIAFSKNRELLQQMQIFLAIYAVIYFLLVYLKEAFYEGAIPWADGFASATAFTGMWLMAKKKVESWWWWIATNTASIPLYFVKGLVFTSVYYFVLLILAFLGLNEWKKKAAANKQKPVLQNA